MRARRVNAPQYAAHLQSVSRKSVIPGTGCVIPSPPSEHFLRRCLSRCHQTGNLTSSFTACRHPSLSVRPSIPISSTCLHASHRLSRKALANDDQSERLQAPVMYVRPLGRLYPLISDRPAITDVTATENDEVYLKPPMLPFASWPSSPLVVAREIAACAALRIVTSREAEHHSFQT